MLQLSSADQKRIQQAQQVLLAPLQYSDAQAWRRAAAAAIQNVLQGDHAYLFEWGPDQFLAATHEVDPTYVLETESYLAAQPESVPLPLRMHAMRVCQGTGVYHEQHLVQRGEVEQDPFFQEVAVPYGVQHATGISVIQDQTETSICVAFEEPDAPGFDPKASEKLALLVPAFEAGLRHLNQFAARRERVHRVLDELTDAVLVFSADGRELHRNCALRQLFASMCDPKSLRDAATEVALSVVDGWSEANKRRVQEVIHCPAGRFVVCGTFASTLFDESASVLVTVTPDSPFPPPLFLRTTFDLTPREAEIALLAAQGYTDPYISDALSISVHTVRCHLSAARAKLDVDSRTALAHRLAQWQTNYESA